MPDAMPKRSLQCPNCGAPAAEDGARCPYCRSVLAVTACPACFGPVFLGMKHCPSCGSVVSRRDAIRVETWLCPSCEQRLEPADVGGVVLHECLGCGGIWLDTAAFQQICNDREQQEQISLFHSGPDMATPQTATVRNRFYIPCPECGNLMNQKNFAGCSGVVIDVCKAHGIWFECLELMHIIRFIQDGGLAKAREQEIAKLQEEQARLREQQYGPQPHQASLLREPTSGLGLTDVLFGIARRFLG